MADPSLKEPSLKRFVDFCGAAVLVCLLSPLLALLAVGVRLTTRGSIFFAQPRIGLRAAEFRMLKFRTMREDCSDEIPRLNEHGMLTKNPNDERVTAFGRWLRRTSLDELPQLLNVLRGEMSLVGPRPLPKCMLTAEPALLAQRAALRPGITGLWQTGHRDKNTSIQYMLPHDLEYVRTVSLRRDVIILLKTVPAVVRGNGAF